VRRPAGKALRKMARCQASTDAPVWGDRRQRLKDEGPRGQLLVGYRKLPRPEAPAAPEHEVEVQDSWTPSSTGPPSELGFDPF